MNGVPRTLIAASGRIWRWDDLEYTEKGPSLTYKSEGYCGLICNPELVETDFTRRGRPEPKSDILVQGKYECGAAALAMLLGEKLFHVKRAIAKQGWRNDDAGMGDKMMIKAARLFGRDLIALNKKEIKRNIGPCTLTISSLNVKGMCHAVTWNGKEILDPNWGRAGRKFWGCEWAPWTLDARGALVLLNRQLSEAERAEYDEAVRAREEKEIKAIKLAVLTALREAS
jgi:hypothetical protein